ncbi:KilA, N-domain protein (fragment) [Xenorhabdus bovienii str. kraussei Becker Underwood]|uniref:KilA, N-domain protein n=1 Tax=Xenorhabdus bovienii str. kraussei Becker Underwood TaxID=1398204 RepID=A0A077PNR9_XENBV
MLDILDREVEKEPQAIKPKTRRSTASQLTPLRQTAERLITTGLGRIYPDIWKLVHEHFEIKHITQLEPTQIAEAIEFLNVLEGEYLGKEELPSPQPAKMDLSLELNNIGVIYKQLKKMTDIWKESIYPALELVNSPIASKFHTYLWDVSGAAHSTKCAIERKA